MKKPELLAPAGSMESLYAAIQGGCDAVYLAGNLYGARSFATNFNEQQLKEAITYAHLYGVKVYVTINTLIYESEVKHFLEYVEFLQTISADAVIVQDLGMMDLLHQLYPSLEIHASTQMHVHNLEGVKLLEELGIKRVVLARETPIELVKKIREHTSLEMEIFIHGSLCISYSGQCLMSSLIGGRSGNRGTCAQCCRQPYDLLVDGKKKNTNSYLLSTKDLNTLENLSSLIDNHVDSFKIEGRMKRPEYVYVVTSIYRKAIDSYVQTGKIEISSQDQEELLQIFNRGFTKGFLFHEDYHQFINEYRPNHMGVPVGVVTKKTPTTVEIKLSADIHVQDGIRILGKEDVGKEIDVIYLGKKRVKEASSGCLIQIPLEAMVKVGSTVVKTTDFLQMKRLELDIHQEKRKVPLTFDAYLYIGKSMKLIVQDNCHTVEVESDFAVEESKKSPVTSEQILTQLQKLGGTVYCLEKADIKKDENIFVPIQKLNELRRLGVEAISRERCYQLPMKRGTYQRIPPNFVSSPMKTALAETESYYRSIVQQDYQEIYVEEPLYTKKIAKNAILKVPRVMETVPDYTEPLLIGELGSLYRYHSVVTDFSFNVVNSYTVAFLHAMGARRVTLSYELNDYQIQSLIEQYRSRYQKEPCLELIVSGRIESMISKYPLLSKYGTGKKNELVDKYHNHFPIVEKNGLLYIYHYQNRQLENPSHYYDMGITSLRYVEKI